VKEGGEGHLPDRIFPVLQGYLPLLIQPVKTLIFPHTMQEAEGTGAGQHLSAPLVRAVYLETARFTGIQLSPTIAECQGNDEQHKTR